MADTKVSALTELTVAPDPTDELLVVDKSDTSMAASGTDKRIQWSNVAGAFIANSIGTTKGDMIAYTGAGAPVRVPVGATDNTVLTAASVVGYGVAWQAPPGFTSFNYFADVGSVTTGETDLFTDTIPSGTLGGNGATLEVVYAGNTVAHATATRTFRVYFAGTAIFTSPALITATNANKWRIEATIMRQSNTVVRYSVQFFISRGDLGAVGITYVSQGSVSSLNLGTTGYITKITGQAGAVGAATNDIVATLGTIRRYISA